MTLLVSRQRTFFLRHALTHLPEPYTPSDASRMLLGYFTISGLDLLGILHDTSKVPLRDRQGFIDWIYSCQCPEGGFRGFTGTDLGDQRNDENKHWDPANVPATFFALMSLLVLGDDLARVQRREGLVWLAKLQREDGSFGEVLGEGGTGEGARDMRFCCCASGVRYVLRGPRAEMDEEVRDVKDVDVDRLVAFVHRSQAYDGGFAGAPTNEAHSGLTYAAIGTLWFLSKLPPDPDRKCPLPDVGGISLERCVQWMLSRQTTFLEEPEDETDDSSDEADLQQAEESCEPSPPTDKVQKGDVTSTPHPPVELNTEDLKFAGFAGRLNKIADTCYCFWNTGALKMLNREHLVAPVALRKYLLEKTQHIVGGFGKGVGATPDIMHAYLGLAALSIYGEADLKPLDPAFCISVEARDRLRNVRWWRSQSVLDAAADGPAGGSTSYIELSGG